jgi:hypothetical protein
VAGNDNMKAASGTYEGFISWVKIGTAITVAIAALVVFVIAT